MMKMSCPVIYADDHKHGLGLTEEEYAVYELARQATTWKKLKSQKKFSDLPDIMEKLQKKRLLLSRKLPDGDLFIWTEEPVSLLENGYFSTLERPARFLDIESPYQRIEFFRNNAFVYFKLNEIIQFHSDEYRICSYPRAELPAELAGQGGRVLILGGGDGLIANEVLKHCPEQITIVEIDKEIPHAFLAIDELKRLCNGSLRRRKVKVIIDDAFGFLNKVESTYDLIYADIELHGTDQPVMNLAAAYFSMLSKCSASLSEKGIFIIMAPLDHLESVFIDRGVAPLLNRITTAGRDIADAPLEDKHFILLRQFFNHVKRVQIKMFFTDAHIIYYCSPGELDDGKVRELLEKNLPKGKLHWS
jgi:spermidine synthase